MLWRAGLERVCAGQSRAPPPFVWRRYVGGQARVRGDYACASSAPDGVLLREDASVLSVREGDSVHDAGDCKNICDIP